MVVAEVVPVVWWWRHIKGLKIAGGRKREYGGWLLKRKRRRD